jgi:hypothetical protein
VHIGQVGSASSAVYGPRTLDSTWPPSSNDSYPSEEVLVELRQGFAATIALANTLPDGVHVTIQLEPGHYSGPDACNATLTHPNVAIIGTASGTGNGTGNGRETTVFDCGWVSRWLAFTGTSLALSGITIINASSFSNGLEAGGVVSGGAVLVDWGGGGTNLSFSTGE